MENEIKTYNSTIRFSKFISNKKIYEEFEGFFSKLPLIYSRAAQHNLGPMAKILCGAFNL